MSRAPVPFAGQSDGPRPLLRGIPFAGAYNPAADDEFVNEFIADLISHPGEWRHSGRVVVERHDPESELLRGGFWGRVLTQYAWEAADLWRRHGHVIEGDRQRGYRWLGCRRPAPFQRPETSFAWPPGEPRTEREREQCAGQLSIEEVG